MDFHEAVVAHTRWKLRLRRFVDGTEGGLDSATTRQADACDVGRWLVAEKDRHGSHPAFGALKAAHAEFHRGAGDIVSCVERGETAAARDLLRPGGPFDEASEAVVTALLKLRKQEAARTA